MKRLLVLVLAVLILFLAACSGAANPAETVADSETGTAVSSDTDTDTETEPDSETKKELTDGVYLLSNGRTSYKVTYPLSFEANFELGLIESFQAEFKKITGVEIASKTDKLAENDKVAELLVGPTNRAASRKLLEDMEALGGHRFGILAQGNKIAVCGTNLYMTYLGLCQMFSDNLLNDPSGKLNIGFENGVEWISDEMPGIPDVAEYVHNSSKLAFYLDEYVLTVPSLTKTIEGRVHMFATLQGGATDGKYVYTAMCNNEGGSYPYVLIFKFDLETWEQVAVSAPVYLGHANDIVCDPVNNRIIVSDCTGDTGYHGLYFLDADTLTLQGTQNVDAVNCAIDYLKDRNGYVLGNGFIPQYIISITDAEFNTLRSFEFTVDTKLIDQGLCTDGRYVYAPMYCKSEVTQYVMIAEVDEDITYDIFPLYNVPESTKEPEFMFRVDDVFYIGFNADPDKIARVQLLPEGWWAADDAE